MLSSTCKCSHFLRKLPATALQLQLQQNRFLTGSKSRVQQAVVQQGEQVPAGGTKWDLYAGVVLERKPLVTQEMTSIEKEYSELLSKYEFELSKKSDHEVRKEKDRIVIEKIKSGEMDSDQATGQTAQDQADLWAAELQQFKIASRTTEADKKNDQKSLQRALDSHLLFVIEQNLGGSEYKWICPHGKRTDGETLRQTAERTLKEVCPEVKAKVLGNAPWGVYKYKYPKNTTTDLSSVGAKIFFYKAEFQSGKVGLATTSTTEANPSSIKIKDYLWLTRAELEAKLHPVYHKTISEFLIDEKN